MGDLYYAGKWHTWLVSGLGPGRSTSGPIADKTTAATGSVFALDITDPSRFRESNAASLVIGDWSSATIRCSNVPDCGSFLGSTSGTPVIRRLHDGSWAALFGNGLNSAKGTAGLFIMLVNAGTGDISFRYIDTGYGSSSGARNGIVQVTPADLDGDHISDYIYAGDALGNLWRFDLSSSDPNAWLPPKTPIFSTPAGQPITSKVTVAAVPSSGASSKPRLIVSFGTGQQLPQTLTSAASYASGTQALYGIWDWNMDNWNAKAGSNGQYQSLVAPQQVGLRQLQVQTVTSTSAGDGTVSSYRAVSRNPVCWKGSSTCSSDNDMVGWTLALPGATEQVIYNPMLSFGMFVVNTTIPPSSAMGCDEKPASGYTMAVTVSGGGAAAKPYFPNTVSEYVGGIGLNAVGTPSVITVRKKAYLVDQTVSGKGAVTQITPPPLGPGGRLNWIQLR